MNPGLGAPPDMSSQDSTPLKSTTRSLAVAAVVILIGVGAAAAFAVGFSGSLEESIANPSSAPSVRIAALERMRDTLGYDGFLKDYRAMIAGDTTAGTTLVKEARDANQALATLRAAGESARDTTQANAIAPYVSRFARAAHNVASGNDAPQLGVLEQSYVAVKALIGEALDSARYQRIAMLSRALSVAQTLAITTLCLLSLTLLGLAWFLRARLLDPLRALRHAAERAADGTMFRQVYGIERNDEIGALARAVNRMRRQLASGAEIEGSPSAEIRGVLDNSAYTASGEGEPGVAQIARESVAIAARDMETRLEEIMGVVAGVRDRIEEASQDAALASKTALEAVDLAREGAANLASKAERNIVATGAQARTTLAALTASVARLNDAVTRLEHDRPPDDRDRRDYREDWERGRERGRSRSDYGDEVRDGLREGLRRAGLRDDGRETHSPREEPRLTRDEARLMRDEVRVTRNDPRPMRENLRTPPPLRESRPIRDDVRPAPTMRDVVYFGRGRDRENDERDHERERPLRAANDRDTERNARTPWSGHVSRIEGDADEREGGRNSVLDGLTHDVERLERLASREGLSADEAAELTASLIEAIDRLNGVAERVADAVSDHNPRSRHY